MTLLLLLRGFSNYRFGVVGVVVGVVVVFVVVVVQRVGIRRRRH
jgi:hypothetical protein